MGQIIANSRPQTPELNKGEAEIQTAGKFRVGNMSIEIESKAARLPSTTGMGHTLTVSLSAII